MNSNGSLNSAAVVPSLCHQNDCSEDQQVGVDCLTSNAHYGMGKALHAVAYTCVSNEELFIADMCMRS